MKKSTLQKEIFMVIPTPPSAKAQLTALDTALGKVTDKSLFNFDTCLYLGKGKLASSGFWSKGEASIEDIIGAATKLLADAEKEGEIDARDLAANRAKIYHKIKKLEKEDYSSHWFRRLFSDKDLETHDRREKGISKLLVSAPSNAPQRTTKTTTVQKSQASPKDHHVSVRESSLQTDGNLPRTAVAISSSSETSITLASKDVNTQDVRQDSQIRAEYGRTFKECSPPYSYYEVRKMGDKYNLIGADNGNGLILLIFNPGTGFRPVIPQSSLDHTDSLKTYFVSGLSENDTVIGIKADGREETNAEKIAKVAQDLNEEWQRSSPLNRDDLIPAVSGYFQKPTEQMRSLKEEEVRYNQEMQAADKGFIWKYPQHVIDEIRSIELPSDRDGLDKLLAGIETEIPGLRKPAKTDMDAAYISLQIEQVKKYLRAKWELNKVQKNLGAKPFTVIAIETSKIH